MSETNKKTNEDILSNSKELISADASLRSLYHFGFNSKSLSKNIISSFKFNEVVSSIKNYVESDELSLKASGHLLVGLLRVYEKKIKIYLEELMTLFKIKKKDSKESDMNNANPALIAQKTKITKNKGNINSIQEENSKNISSTATAEKSSLSSYFNKNNHLLSLSPLNDELFSMLNENLTPNTYNRTIINSANISNSNNTTPRQIEAYRAINQNSSAALDSKSKAIIEFNSNIKSSTNPNYIANDNTIHEEENDMNNFFQFISENVLGHPELPADIDNEYNTNYEMAEPQTDESRKNFLFNSESKPHFNFDTEFHNFRQKNKNKKNSYIPNLEVDEVEEMHIDLEKAIDFALAEESVHDVMKRYKSEWLVNDKEFAKGFFENKNKNEFFSFDKIFANQLINPKINANVSDYDSISKENKRNADSDYEESFVNNFSNIDIKDFNINGNEIINVHEKLSKIFEEEEKIKGENNFMNDFDNFDKQGEMNIFDKGVENIDFNNSLHLGDNLDSNLNRTRYSNFNERIHAIFKKKKREITFSNLSKNEKIKNDFQPYETFYNLLSLAQREEITLSQEEIFHNDKIYISIPKYKNI